LRSARPSFHRAPLIIPSPTTLEFTNPYIPHRGSRTSGDNDDLLVEYVAVEVLDMERNLADGCNPFLHRHFGALSSRRRAMWVTNPPGLFNRYNSSQIFLGSVSSRKAFSCNDLTYRTMRARVWVSAFGGTQGSMSLSYSLGLPPLQGQYPINR
jgi:hypothetical protein